MDNEIQDKPEPGNNKAQVQRWHKEIELALKSEKTWRDDAKKAIKVYNSEPEGGDDDHRTFNILWSNVEIKRQAIYSALPSPDIRRRHRDKDPVAKAVSEVLERCTSYVLDCKDVDTDLIAATNDMLLPGRAITRINLKSEVNDDDTVSSQDLDTQQWQWDKFIRGPGKSWDEVPWIGFEHNLYKDEVKARWPDFAGKLSYDQTELSSSEELDESNKSVFSRTTIYEIWNKQDKKVYWVGKTLKDEFLSVDDDPLELRGFWPIPRPLHAIESSVSLIPQTEYSKYQVLAEELEIVTKRRNKIASALRVRGVYDTSLAEMEQLLQAGDNKLIPAENIAQYVERGGLDKAIWMLPIKELAEVYAVLGKQRDELIAQIFEITGISDIVRGDTNPNETATAQKIKGNFASLRLEKQKSAQQKYSRDLIRLIVEIISEKFTRETLSAMSGLNFPTREDMQRAQMLVQQFQAYQQQQAEVLQGGQPQTPPEVQQAQELLQSGQPTWEDIEEVLHDDLSRDYRIDIETDSTVAIDQMRDQQNISEFVNGLGNFVKFAAEAQGIITPEAAKKMVVSMSRKFKLGREVEDELEREQPPQQGPSPEEQKFELEKQRIEMQTQADQQKSQMELQAQQQKQQFEAERAQLQAQVDQQKAQMEMQKQQAEMAVEREKLANERAQVQFEREKLENKNAYDQAQHKRKMEVLTFDREKGELKSA